jgi:RimJ/RimL family protein N-acetyltransferase
MTAINGKLVSLRPANPGDRRHVFEWLAESDLTSKMLGPPDFPDNPVPDWDEFINDYTDEYFNTSHPELGRSFIIEVGGTPAGHISYNLLDSLTGTFEFDIWMAASSFCNKGLGTDAINALCDYLARALNGKTFVLAPSSRNKGAVRAYRKCGFEPVEEPPPNFVADYYDTLILVRKAR